MRGDGRDEAPAERLALQATPKSPGARKKVDDGAENLFRCEDAVLINPTSFLVRMGDKEAVVD